MLTRACAEPDTYLSINQQFRRISECAMPPPPGPRMRGAPNFAERKVRASAPSFFNAFDKIGSPTPR